MEINKMCNWKGNNHKSINTQHFHKKTMTRGVKPEQHITRETIL